VTYLQAQLIRLAVSQRYEEDRAAILDALYIVRHSGMDKVAPVEWSLRARRAHGNSRMEPRAKLEPGDG
jgi:hypothetical protein